MFSHRTQGLANTSTTPTFFVLVQITLKIYSFQAAGKNKITAKNCCVCVCVRVRVCVCVSDARRF